MIRETLIWSNYQFRTKRQSNIDQSATVTEDAGFGCPNCHEVVMDRATIKHGETYTHHCGLTMTRYGNALECEMDGPERSFEEIHAELNEIRDQIVIGQPVERPGFWARLWQWIGG